MLTEEGCRTRRERLWHSLKEPLDWIVLHEPQHLIYFASFYPNPFSYSTQNGGAVLILGADRSAHLIVDNLQASYLEQAHVDSYDTPLWYRGKETAPYRTDLLVKTALDALSTRKGTHIGIEPATPAGVVEGLRFSRPSVHFTDVSPLIHQMKRSKYPDEMALMRRSISAAEAGFKAGMEKTVPGMTELEMYALICDAVYHTAGERVVVYGDFATGTRVFGGGGVPTNRVIESDDLVLLDFSAVVFGYRGDFANTFVVAGGKCASKQKELAGIALEGLKEGEKSLKPGISCKQIDANVRNLFRGFGVNKLFPHHLGHGVGLGHPDPPYIVPESSDTLVVGDMVTLEPGLYLPGEAGMRFERNYLITDTGYTQLSHHHIGLY